MNAAWQWVKTEDSNTPTVKKNNYDFTLDLLIPMLVLVFPSTEVGEGGRWQKIVFTDIFIWRMTAVAAMHLVSPLTCSMGGGCFRQNTRPLDLFTRSLISSILGQAAVSRRVLSEEVNWGKVPLRLSQQKALFQHPIKMVVMLSQDSNCLTFAVNSCQHTWPHLIAMYFWQLSVQYCSVPVQLVYWGERSTLFSAVEGRLCQESNNVQARKMIITTQEKVSPLKRRICPRIDFGDPLHSKFDKGPPARRAHRQKTPGNPLQMQSCRKRADQSVQFFWPVQIFGQSMWNIAKIANAVQCHN